MNLIKIFSLILVSYFISACSTDHNFKTKLTQTLKENPDILLDVIKENPSDFLLTLQEAGKKAQYELAQKRQKQEEKELQEAFENPFKPNITKETIVRGAQDAPITIVEYSDFECPFCSKSYLTVQNLLKRYPGKIQFIYKHLPLSFHENAMITAQYYEAIALQSKEKAIKFHDTIFQNQKNLRLGEKYLNKVTKKLGIDLAKLNQDLNSKKVIKNIENDINEAKKFGMSGTPGFLINGIPIKGAYPEEYFVDIIQKLKEKKKLNL